MDRLNIRLKTKTKTIVIKTNTGEFPIKAEFAFTMYGYDFYINRALETNYNPRWCITEYKTGRYVAEGNTKREAISNAKKILKQKGTDTVLKAIEKREIINK